MELLKRFEEHLQNNLIQIESYHPFYQEAINYMLEAGGKRFRPLLLLSVVDAYAPLLVPSALDVALAVEFLHTYSLIHDDLPVMDDADLRRGHQTLHKRYDEVSAVLVGDGLNTHAFYLIAQSALSGDVKTALTRELAYNGGLFGMVHGQILDCHFEKKKLSLQELEILHLNKTAKLIAASLKMGAIIADKKELEEPIYDFGLDLGLLFQIQDDIIDALATKEEAGKTTQNDTFKNSFVNLLGTEGAMKKADEVAKKVRVRLRTFDETLQEKLSFLQDYIDRHHKVKERNG
jgi:farnesyl diphosphate synthase